MPTCKKCGAEFLTGPEVGEHVKAAHTKIEEVSAFIPYKCYSCPSVFHTHEELSTHRGEHQTTYAVTKGRSHKVEQRVRYLPEESFWAFYHRKYPDVSFATSMLHTGADDDMVFHALKIKRRKGLT